MAKSNDECTECDTKIVSDNASSIMGAYGTYEMNIEYCPQCGTIFHQDIKPTGGY